jgi:Arc/MetJ-type ribon-helix-helix transcriptional regulator
MAATVAQPQKELLRELLKAGRWTNESEIVRYGIELVRREVERERLAPVPDKVLARCYKQMSAEELAEDRKLGAASAQPSAKDLE